jgi:hypothetical protein
VFKRKLYSRLDQYLKVQVQNKGITIIKNTYTGFDTEFEEDKCTTNKNKLLSVQTYVKRRVIMNLAHIEPFYISYIHPITSAVSEVFKNKVDGYQYKYIFLEDASLSVWWSSFFKKNLKKGNERKQI